MKWILLFLLAILTFAMIYLKINELVQIRIILTWIAFTMLVYFNRFDNKE